MIRVLLASLAFILGVSTSASSFAAIVTVLQGQVLVNRGGQGYQLVEGSSEANPGDMVVVNPGGIAQIVYPDGCTVQVQPPSVVAIAPQSPCQTEQEASQQPSVNGTTLAIGAVVVVGGGVAAAILLSQKKDKPASP
jgi:hypothetical protein